MGGFVDDDNTIGNHLKVINVIFDPIKDTINKFKEIITENVFNEIFIDMDNVLPIENIDYIREEITKLESKSAQKLKEKFDTIYFIILKRYKPLFDRLKSDAAYKITLNAAYILELQATYNFLISKIDYNAPITRDNMSPIIKQQILENTETLSYHDYLRTGVIPLLKRFPREQLDKQLIALLQNPITLDNYYPKCSIDIFEKPEAKDYQYLFYDEDYNKLINHQWSSLSQKIICIHEFTSNGNYVDNMFFFLINLYNYDIIQQIKQDQEQEQDDDLLTFVLEGYYELLTKTIYKERSRKIEEKETNQKNLSNLLTSSTNEAIAFLTNCKKEHDRIEKERKNNELLEGLYESVITIYTTINTQFEKKSRPTDKLFGEEVVDKDFYGKFQDLIEMIAFDFDEELSDKFLISDKLPNTQEELLKQFITEKKEKNQKKEIEKFYNSLKEKTIDNKINELTAVYKEGYETTKIKINIIKIWCHLYNCNLILKSKTIPEDQKQKIYDLISKEQELVLKQQKLVVENNVVKLLQSTEKSANDLLNKSVNMYTETKVMNDIINLLQSTETPIHNLLEQAKKEYYKVNATNVVKRLLETTTPPIEELLKACHKEETNKKSMEKITKLLQSTSSPVNELLKLSDQYTKEEQAKQKEIETKKNHVTSILDSSVKDANTLIKETKIKHNTKERRREIEERAAKKKRERELKLLFNSTESQTKDLLKETEKEWIKTGQENDIKLLFESTESQTKELLGETKTKLTQIEEEIARKQAEQEAQLKAEQEAQLKAEEEEKLKAEQEARKQKLAEVEKKKENDVKMLLESTNKPANNVLDETKQLIEKDKEINEAIHKIKQMVENEPDPCLKEIQNINTRGIAGLKEIIKKIIACTPNYELSEHSLKSVLTHEGSAPLTKTNIDIDSILKQIQSYLEFVKESKENFEKGYKTKLIPGKKDKKDNEDNEDTSNKTRKNSIQKNTGNNTTQKRTPPEKQRYTNPENTKNDRQRMKNKLTFETIELLKREIQEAESLNESLKFKIISDTGSMSNNTPEKIKTKIKNGISKAQKAIEQNKIVIEDRKNELAKISKTKR